MSNKGLMLCVMVMMAVTSHTESMKCYHCKDASCATNEAMMETTCASSHATCMTKTIDGEVVKKRCGVESECEAITAFKKGVDTVKKAIDSIGNFFGSKDDKDEAVITKEEALLYECCSTDYCNTATGRIASSNADSSKMINQLLLMLPLFFYLLSC